MRGRALAAALAAAWLAPHAQALPALTSVDALLRDHLWHELRALPASARPTVGLVLSAGSMRALAHVGVISVLDDAGFPVDVVAGTSMGALVAGAYADGWTSRRMRDYALNLSLKTGSNYTSYRLLRLALFDSPLSSQKTEDFIRANFKAKRFHELKRPFACVSMDLHSGEAIIFRHGDLAAAIRASMNLPGIFSPVEYRHRYLVDGGVVDYIPIDAARLLGAQWVLASITELDYTSSKPRSMLESLEQVIDIRGSLLSQAQRRAANFLIEPQTPNLSLLDSSGNKAALERGAITAYRKLPAAQESLILFSLASLARRWGTLTP